MARWTLVRETDNELTILKDGIGYSNIDPAGNLPDNLHALQWYETYGDEEIRDPSTGRIVENRDIDNLDNYTWMEPLWQAAYDEHLAALKQAAYDAVIAEGGTAEEAQAAADAITSV